MATFNKLALCPSGTEGTGAGILVVGTSSASATAIHRGPSTSTTYDEVWIYASNTSTSSNKLTIEYGGSSAGFILIQTIPAQAGLVLLVPGLIVKGVNSPESPIDIKAWSTTTGSVVNIFGYVNRIVA